MPILAAIVSMLALAGVWWWRAQRAHDAASAAIGLAGQARGAVNRARFRNKSKNSVLTAIDDSRIAAAVMLYRLMADRRPLTRADEERLGEELETVCGMQPSERSEAVAFAAWAAAQVADTNEIVRRLTPMWKRELTELQRRELVAMTLRLAGMGGDPLEVQMAAVRKLGEQLLPQAS
jgi:uncharacterized tellurite resistance protein B-like protein